MPLTTESAARKDRTQPTEANFQHRHYAEIARIIRAMHGHLGLHMSSADVTATAQHFADELAGSNPRFDRSRFLAACKP
jgi:hypothetical protein